MPEIESVAYALLCLFLGGLVKGVVGLGLPLVSLPLLAAALPLKTAVALLVMPVFATNIAQLFQGGRFGPTIRRFWPTVAVLTISIMVAAQALVVLPERVLYITIGTALTVLTVAMRFRPTLRLAPSQEKWAGAAAGAVAGVLGGISAIYGPPLMMFLASLRLSKQEFVPAISLLLLAGNSGLTIGLLGFGAADFADMALSLLAVLPTAAGLWLGQRVHMRLDERRFGLALDAIYLVTAVSFLARAAV